VSLTDSEILCVLIHRSLDVGRDRGCTLVENGKFRKVVEESRHSHLQQRRDREHNESCWNKEKGRTYSLFLSSTEQIFPFFPRIQTSFSRRNVSQMSSLKDLEEISVGFTGFEEVGVRVRVDDLIA